MNDDRANGIIWKEARTYLNKKGISDDAIDLHLNLYQQVRPNSINDVYSRLLASLINRQGVSNWIGEIQNLEPFFKNYSPKYVLSQYRDWEDIIDSIAASDFEPPSEINKKDPRNSWVHFTKGTYEGAKYLSKFKTHIEFDETISKYLDKNQHVQLAQKISSDIHGIGFALACDFLKELGYSDFVKPDVHIIEIFNGLGLVQSEKPERVFTSVLNYADSIGEIPYRVDKMFWLIGSGYFYLLPGEPRIPTDRDEFCRHVRNMLTDQGFEVKYNPKKTEKTESYIDEVQKTDYKHVNEMLTELRRLEEITANQYRDYAKKWRDYEDMRKEITQELSLMLSK